MKIINLTLLIFLIVLIASSCMEEFATTDLTFTDDTQTQAIPLKGKKFNKATGSVEIIWKGGEKGSEMGNKPENLRAFFEFNAHENLLTPKGEVVYTVTDEFLNPHREIVASVIDVKVNPVNNKSWFIARVISDSKGCSGGSGNGGHETGCSGGDEGGCGDDTEHDGGCTHDTGTTGGTDHTDGGGCSNDTGTDHTDGGGCTDEHTDGESCSGSDSGHPGSPGSTDKGNPLSGKNCRMGQIIVVKVHDKATPGSAGDGLTWKWFGPEHTIDIEQEPEHLCKKEIIAGNLVVHVKG